MNSSKLIIIHLPDSCKTKISCQEVYVDVFCSFSWQDFFHSVPAACGMWLNWTIRWLGGGVCHCFRIGNPTHDRPISQWWQCIICKV